MTLTQPTYECTFRNARIMDDGGSDELSPDGLATMYLGEEIRESVLFAMPWNWDAKQIPSLGTGYSKVITGNKQIDPLTVEFIPVNSIPMKMITSYENKGHISYVENSTHVYEDMPLTVGGLQKYQFLKERSAVSFEYLSSFANALNIKYDNENRVMIANMEFKPYVRNKTTATPSSRAYPKTLAGVEVKGGYTNLTVSTWDGNPWAELDSIDIGFARNSKIMNVNKDNTSGKFYHIYSQPRTLDTMFTIVCKDLAEGQEDDMEDGTKRTINLRVTKPDPTKYYDITLYNCLVFNPQESEIRDDVLGYALMGYAEDWTIICPDGLADSVLDEPTES